MTDPEEFVRLNCPAPEGRSSSFMRIFLALVLLSAVGATLLGSNWTLKLLANHELRHAPDWASPVTAAQFSSAQSSPNLPFLPAQRPLAFEPNLGQTDARVKFLARSSGYGLFL